MYSTLHILILERRMALVTDFHVRGRLVLLLGAEILMQDHFSFMGAMYSPRAQCHR